MQAIYTQRSVQPDQCYFTVQITGSNVECSLYCYSTVMVCIALQLHIIWWEMWLYKYNSLDHISATEFCATKPPPIQLQYYKIFSESYYLNTMAMPNIIFVTPVSMVDLSLQKKICRLSHKFFHLRRWFSLSLLATLSECKSYDCVLQSSTVLLSYW